MILENPDVVFDICSKDWFFTHFLKIKQGVNLKQRLLEILNGYALFIFVACCIFHFWNRDFLLAFESWYLDVKLLQCEQLIIFSIIFSFTVPRD